MIIKELTLSDFRNYEALNLSFDRGTNLLYGDNAQGKTNLLEAIYLSCTTKSHKGAKDAELIRFEQPEAHIRSLIDKEGATYRVDMHLKRGGAKGLALDGIKMKRAAEFLEKLRVNIVLFSPEDLSIVKSGPSERRRFLDLELCQTDPSYTEALSSYHRALKERAKLLKTLSQSGGMDETLLDLYDEQLVKHGKLIIDARKRFLEELNKEVISLHESLSGGREFLRFIYEPKAGSEEFADLLFSSRRRDIYTCSTNTGPHRDDFSFLVKKKGEDIETDLRRFGSQGQQRSAALSLKLSEIGLIRRISSHTPLLLLDDVLSELDASRQNALLKTIGSMQTIITCTGLDEFVENNFAIDRLIHVKSGRVSVEDEDR